jgi:hypothetical protein
MAIKLEVPSNLVKDLVATRILDNEIDWIQFANAFNPGIVKNAQNLAEFDNWISWIKRSFDMTRPFNYLEIGSYAGESLFYLSQIFPRGSIITLVDLGDVPKAREILVKHTIPYVERHYGHKVHLLTGFSDDPGILNQVMAYPQGQKLYDMVFIDANHDFKWAYKDFMNYRDKAHYVAFHDISEFNITKTVAKYGKELANAAHLWKSIKTVVPAQTWVEFVDPNENHDLKPRGIGVLKLP